MNNYCYAWRTRAWPAAHIIIYASGADQRRIPTLGTGRHRRRYLYMAQLRVLDGRRPGGGTALPDWLRKVQTPLVVAEWRRQLASHPDEEYTQ